MTTQHVDTEADVRARQTRILQVLASRLTRGDQLLPADLIGRLSEELELRIDEDAIAAAWATQGNTSPHPWRGEAARASRRARGRDVREVWILEHAEKNLESLEPQAREEIGIEIDALAFDPLPRGAAALHGRKDDHVYLRVGDRRLLYKVLHSSVIVVAVTSYE